MRPSSALTLVVFRIGQNDFCAPLSVVQEVLDASRLVTLPRAPEFMAGIVNLRGHVIAVVNLRRNFPQEVQNTAGTHIIIAMCAGAHVGLMVDSVRKVVAVPKSDFTQPATTPAGADRSIILASIIIEGSTVYLLDTEKLFKTEEFALLKAVD